MNRRDMIIVAALINAALLIVLFVAAVKPGNAEEKSSLVGLEPSVQMETAVIKPVKTVSKGDQIDQVISEYNAKVAEKERFAETKSIPLSVLTPEPKVAKAEETTKGPLEQTSKELQTMRVEKGDVLERIARYHGVSVEEIMKLNGLSSSRLQIGQELKLPAKSKVKTPKKQVQIESKYYTFKGGYNPWTIAKKNGMQVEELLELNNMDEEKAKRLRPGDKLKIK